MYNVPCEQTLMLTNRYRADYLHCVILFSCLLVLVLATYTRGDVIGSPGRLYDLLLEASEVISFDNAPYIRESDS